MYRKVVNNRIKYMFSSFYIISVLEYKTPDIRLILRLKEFPSNQ